METQNVQHFTYLAALNTANKPVILSNIDVCAYLNHICPSVGRWKEYQQ